MRNRYFTDDAFVLMVLCYVIPAVVLWVLV